MTVKIATGITVAFLLLIVMLACHRKTGSQSQTSQSQDSTSATAADTTGPAKKDSMLVASFRKTACFGTCPVYEVKFYDNCTVTWNGRMNVERMGMHKARVSKSTLKDIQRKAQEAGFFEMQDKYPVESRVADLPSTITYVRLDDKEKQVNDTYEAPESLKEFEKFMEDLIGGLEWKPATDN